MDVTAKLEKLEAENEELKALNAYLASELGLARDALMVSKLMTKLRIGRTHADFLLGLYNSRNGLLSKLQLYEISRGAGRSDEPSLKVIEVQVSKLRKAIGRNAIDTEYGTSYRLSPVGVRLVEDALAA